jgi:hypothetical protein
VPFALAGPAQADSHSGVQSHFSFSFADTFVSNDLCPFPVQIDYSGTVTGHGFDGQDSNGNLTIFHVTETDNFTGPNGATLAGLPYSATQHLTDAGVNHSAGHLEVVPLNNGTTFVSTGLVNFNTFTGDWVLVGTSGHGGDVAEFCAELAS